MKTVIYFLIFVGEEAIEFWEVVSLKRQRDERRKHRLQMGCKR